MGKYYPPNVIDELMEKIPYESVLNYYGNYVKGRGKSRGSDCPKCGKNHEHFKINTQRNVAKCFVCQWSGNPIQYIQLVDNVKFIEAVEKFAEIGNVKLPETNNKEISRKEKMLYHAAKYYSNFQSDYLINRGITEQVIQDNMIGFAKGGTGLKKHLNSLSFSDEELLEVGLIRNRQNNILMDYFFDCVIIPIFHNGRVIDLYGRYIKPGKLKHVYLYGDFFAYNLDKCNPKFAVVIVESKINALTLMSHSTQNVIAVGGAEKFTSRHAKLLNAKGIKKVFIGYDTGDLSKGGQKGAINTGYLLNDVGIESYVMQMPESTDINELYLSYENPHEEFRKLVKESKVYSEFEAKFILDNMSIKWIQDYLYERLTL